MVVGVGCFVGFCVGGFGAVGFLGVVFAKLSGSLWMFELYKNVYIYNLV